MGRRRELSIAPPVRNQIAQFQWFNPAVPGGALASVTDDLSLLIGHKLLRIETKPGPNIPEPTDLKLHESCLLEVTTDHGFITLVSHTENDKRKYGVGFYHEIRTVSTPDKISYGRGISCEDASEFVDLVEYILRVGNGRPVPISKLRHSIQWLRRWGGESIDHLYKSLATLVEGGALDKSESGYALSQQTKDRLPDLLAKAYEGWGEGHWIYDWWKKKYGGYEWWSLFEKP